MIYYLDTNVILSMFVEDAHSDRIDTWLNAEQRAMLVSVWTEAEVCDVLRRQARSGILTRNAADTALADFVDWLNRSAERLDLNASAGHFALSLIGHDSLKLSAPDSLHLGLAITSKSTLVTFDLRLAEAARVKGHPVVVP